MSIKILSIFCAVVALGQAQLGRFPRRDPLEAFRKKDSVIFTQYDADDDKAFIEYAPADPNDQNVDADNTLNSTVIIYTKEGFVAEYWGLVASYDAKKVWMNNFRQSALVEYNVAKSAVTTVAKDLTGGLEDLAYDRVTKVLYWTDSISNIIMAMNTSSYRHFTKIWTSDDVSPYALALHTTKRKLFFGVYKLEGSRISKTELIKCDLDGSNRQTILRFPDVIRPRGMTIDFSDDKLYWTDINFSLHSVVMASDLNGRQRRQFFAAPDGFLWDIAHYGNYLYITDLVNTTVNEYSIYIREKNGRRGRTVTTNFKPRNVDIYAPNEVSATRVPNECENNRCEHICVAQRGRYACKCSPGYTLVSGYKCVAKTLIDDYLLVADIGQKRVFQVALKTSAFLVDEIIAMPWDDETNEKIFAAAVDHKNGDLAWYDQENKQLLWGDRRIYFSGGVTSIAVHCCEDRIFWSSSTEILSWDGRSSRYESVYALSFFSNSEIRQITIDCIRGHLYWVEYDSVTRKAMVKRSDMDGKDVEVVLRNLPATKGITIDYESYVLYVMTMLDGMLYSLPLKFLEKIPSTNLNHYQYDSTDLSASFGSEIVVIWDICVKNGMVYLADSENSKIRRYSIRRGPSSMEDYGPSGFFLPVTLDFYDKQYHDKYTKPSCPGNDVAASQTPRQIRKEPSTTPTTTAAKDCDSILTDTDDLNAAINQFIQCILGEM